jgi:hypothetical protein
MAGWRPSSPGRPGGVLLADRGQWVGVGTLNLPGDQRAAVVGPRERYGQRHSTGTITIPTDCIEAVVHYTSRTPTHGHLREAFCHLYRTGRQRTIRWNLDASEQPERIAGWSQAERWPWRTTQRGGCCERFCRVGGGVAAVNCRSARDGQMARASSPKAAATRRRLCRASSPSS